MSSSDSDNMPSVDCYEPSEPVTLTETSITDGKVVEREVIVHKHTEIQGSEKPLAPSIARRNDRARIAEDEALELLRKARTPVSASPMDVDGYETLARVLIEAYNQSARGKGLQRHGQGLPFDEQAINTIPRLLRSAAIGASTYQTIKKQQEAIGMLERGDFAAAKAEMLGSIVYTVASILIIEAAEQKSKN